MDLQAKADATGHGRPCNIPRSPSELPSATIGRRPMYSLMPTWLAGPAVDSPQQAEKLRLAIAHLELGLDRPAHDLLRRHTIDGFGRVPHEKVREHFVNADIALGGSASFIAGASGR
jgi:hypothetical protein